MDYWDARSVTGVGYLMQFAGTVILVGINEKYIKQMTIRSPPGN